MARRAVDSGVEIAARTFNHMVRLPQLGCRQSLAWTAAIGPCLCGWIRSHRLRSPLLVRLAPNKAMQLTPSAPSRCVFQMRQWALAQLIAVVRWTLYAVIY